MGAAARGGHTRLREGRAPDHARGGPEASQRAPPAALQQLHAGEIGEAPPNLPLGRDGRHAFSATAPNRLWVTDITEFRLPGDARRVYGLPVARHRLLRRQARRVVRRDEADGRARRLEPAGGLRDALARRAPGHPLRPRPPLPLARLGVDLRCRGARQEHVLQGASGDNARAEGFFGLLKNEFFRC